MAVVTARPTYAPALEGGNSYKITFPIEQVRLYAYFFFVTLCGFAIILFNILVKPLIEAGAPEGTPIERLGCGYFNRESDRAKSYYGMTKFGLDFGEGFDLETSHLTELFGFTNVCVYWDYEPAHQIVAMYFPLFEYSLAIYLFFDFVNTMLAYKRGELPEWYWSLVKIVTPFTIILIAWFRMIFVFVAYEQPQYHSGAFLGMQIALFSVALTNTWYVLLTGQSYPTIGLSARGTAVLANTYLICNVAISSVKMYSTAYIVNNIHAPPYYLYATPIPGMCLGQVIDMFWMIFNAIIPIFVSYTRRINENPLTVKFSVPIPFYGGDESEPDEAGPEDVEPTETTSLLQLATPEEPGTPAKSMPIEPAKSIPTEPSKTTTTESAKRIPAEPEKPFPIEPETAVGPSGDESEPNEAEPEDDEPTETAGLIQPPTPEEPGTPSKNIPIERTERIPTEPAETTTTESAKNTPAEPEKTSPIDPAKTVGPITLGTYTIKTTVHEASGCPADWGLSAWRQPSDGVRNDASTWVAAHDGDVWPSQWEIKKGRVEGTYQIVSKPHAKSQHPGGWGLCAFPRYHGAKRNEVSTKIAAHKGGTWPMDWKIVPGRTKGTYQIVTTEFTRVYQKAGWGLSAWGPKVKDTIRSSASSWVHIHEGTVWPMDWILEKQEPLGLQLPSLIAPITPNEFPGFVSIRSVSSKNYLNGRNKNPQNIEVWLDIPDSFRAKPKYFKWTFEKVGTQYKIRSNSSGLYIDRRDPNHVNQDGVVVLATDEGTNTKYLLWDIEKVDGNYALKSNSSGAYLDGRVANLTRNKLWLTNRPPKGDGYLQWIIEPH